MPNTREKLMRLLCHANSKATEAEAFEDATYAEQLGIQADHLIANGVTVQKWIPVSEPPKEMGCYIVTVKHWLDGKPVIVYAFWNSVDWLTPIKREEITPRVTHWMPLPEPAKGE